ncbi:MAG: peptidoglycan bridge formation protein FemAB [Hydrogenophilales bacterium 16-64-46]|nr:MAG: peptidoglycan bridge formation protein FemAB [Hydrogenophilales bacterium 12-64-13]OYZ07220.1 MAG: peptidoglycan bridge formation protein FemAB [Hydrogenophilales bacterium 16-64-46]OZA37406.1 MAG: peptidoglycan bridge formation protein FemAB [Hydrogenophilales bacterium 17-64-34]HQS98936.1 FemAB family PEP-CTERM system-associated protein [Thiobacillus sp.]
MSAVSLAPVASGAAVKVRALVEADRARWDEYVLAHPDASFFHRAGWQSVIQQAFGHRTHFLLAERAGAIVGVLPLAEIRSRVFGHSLGSLPFCAYGGIVADDDEATRALDSAAQSLAARLKVGALEYRNQTAQHPDWPTKSLYVTFKRAILSEVEANMNAIPRKQRAMVRKGIKAGLTGEIDSDTERFFRAYSASVHRLGTPVFSRKFFRLLKAEFGDDCEVLSIVREGELIASVMSFYFRDEVLPYYGGGTDAARAVAGNDFMYWDLMRRACERGLKVFDFGRSKHGTGSFDFKKNWGFEATPLYYEYFLVSDRTMPEINPLNPKYRLFIQVWKKLPLPLANAIGPHIVRQLG